MGGICSKNSDHSGGHTVLSSGSPPSGGRLGGAPNKAANNGPSSGRVGGGASGGGGSSGPSDIRSAALEAAERRQKEAQGRGTHASNPNRGKLAANANKPAKFTPEPREEPRLVWD